VLLPAVLLGLLVLMLASRVLLIMAAVLAPRTRLLARIDHLLIVRMADIPHG